MADKYDIFDRWMSGTHPVALAEEEGVEVIEILNAIDQVFWERRNV